jgi:hypothetical protein
METIQLNRIDAETAYNELSPHINRTVHQFCSKHRCHDIEERESEANTIFFHAVQRIPRYACTNMPGHISRVVYRKLHERWRTSTRIRNRRLQPLVTSLVVDHEQPALRDFNVLDFLAGLQPDARECARIVLDDTFDCSTGEPGPRELRKRVRTVLKAQGWGHQRIERAFRLVEAAL